MKIVESIAESLRYEMHRGMGEGVACPFPVALEPPFSPFQHPNPHTRRGGSITPATATEAELIPRSDLRFLKVRLSSQNTYDLRLSEQQMLAFSPRNPVAFEVHGHGGSVSFQYVAAKQDASNLVSQLHSHYPGAQVFEGPDVIGGEDRPHLIARNYRLRESHLFQIRVEQRPESFTALVGILAGLSHGEFGSFQVLFQPVRFPWYENILNVASDLWDPNESAFVDLPDLPRKARGKVERPLFAVAVRLAASDKGILKTLEGSFLSQFETTENSLVASAPRYPEEAVLGRFTCTPGMLLNVRELAAIAHLPDPATLPRGTVEMAAATAKAPPSASHPLVVLGVNSHQGAEMPVGIDEHWMARHIFIEGFTGSGKTTVLKAILIALMEQGYALAFFDYAGDAAEELLDLVPESRIQDVIYFNPGDRDFPPGLNVLQSSEREQEMLASELMVGLKRIFRGRAEFGPRMEWILRQTVHTLLASSGEKTLRDISRFLMDHNYRQEVLRTVSDPDVRLFWRTRGQLSSGVIDPILSRLSTFLDRPTIRNIVSQPNLIDLNQAMNQGKIVVFNLSKGILGEENSQVLGSFILSKLQLAAMARAEMSPSERKLFVVAIDEFQNQGGRDADTASVRSFLSEARKYGVGLVTATQYISQLDRDVVSAIFGNVGTLICLRCGIDDAPILQRELGSFTADDLLNLATGQAIVRMGRAEDTFNVDIPSPAYQATSFRDRIVQISRECYCRPKAEVEELLWSSVEPESPESQSEAFAPPKSERRAGTTVSQTTRQPDRESARVEPSSTIPEEKLKEGFEARQPRNTSQHRYLQNLIKRMAEERGYRAIIEQPTPDGNGKVDVGLERDGKRIACEISVTTSEEHELSNIEKCLRAGFDIVVLCSLERRILDKVKALASQKFSGSDLEKVLFLQPEELFFYLEQEAASEGGTEERVKGYRVKVQYQPLADSEKEARREAVTQVIFHALRRLRDREGN